MAGQPIFVKPLSLGTIATGNQRAGYPAAHLGRHKAIGLTWRSDGASNLWVRGDLGAVKDIDFCAILSANAIPSTTIRLRLGDTQGEVDGSADYDSGALPFINPSITRDDGLYHSHLELPALFTKRWYRIDIGGHAGDFAGAMLVIGRKIRSAKFYDFDHERGVDDSGGGDITRHGVWDDEPGRILRTLDMTLNWLTEAEWETGFGPLAETVGTSQPVYCCFDPEASVYRQRKTYYGRFSKAPYARGKRKPNSFGGEFRILSLI
jgi:hypothetical protein